MKKNMWMMLFVAVCTLGSSVICFAEMDVPKKKQTVLGLYITAQDAFTKWHVDPDTVQILDVRTPEEYMFVGHATMAANIPIKFLIYEIDPVKKRPVMKINENFIAAAKKRYNTEQALYVMCKAGGRSAIAVNKLAEAGFKNVYNIIDGFEGDPLNVPGSYRNGNRIVNGWKNADASWTHHLEPKLMYLP